MAYHERIKNFQKIRSYMREFYIYGFKSREEYDSKSARSYDNGRRRIESWLCEYMFFRQEATGKQVFLSVDSRNVLHNPLYQAFKAKSFTRGDLLLHFYLLDILTEGACKSIQQIMEHITTDYLVQTSSRYEPDESTVRKKLREYEQLGLLMCEKQGRELRYCRTISTVDLGQWQAAVTFFSEVDPLGVIGSYLLDKPVQPLAYFSFKHHYILHVLDSIVVFFGG